MKRFLLSICACGLLAALSAPSSLGFAGNFDYVGQVKGEPGTYVGFFLERSAAGKKRVDTFTVSAIPYDCRDAPSGNTAGWSFEARMRVRSRLFEGKGDWVGLMKRNQKTSSAKAPAAGAAAAAPAAPAAAPDDLTQISGIGPRLSSILSRGGVTTYSQLEQMSPDELREIIALGGALPPASLSSWPAQASYAVRGDFSGLASYNRSR